MARRRDLRNLLFFASVIFATFFLDSSRIFVNGRSLHNNEATTDHETTTEYRDELTTQATKASTIDGISWTTENVLKANEGLISIVQTVALTTSADPDNSSSSEAYSFTPSYSSNRSLYEELKATSNFPSSFETSSEFIKFEISKLESNSDESKSEEQSMDEKYKKDVEGFKKNATNEERHLINEAIIDEETVKYSSIIMNKTKEDEDLETTAQPVVISTMKKGKYLEMMPTGEDNMNASIPDTAEVWALAGMHDVETRKPFSSDDLNSEVELLNNSLNNTAKNLLDWSEIARMNNDTMMQMTSDDSQRSHPTKSTIISDMDDPATSENKDVGIFVTQHPATTLKTAAGNNRLELESGHAELGNLNKTNSRIDSDVFTKGHDEREESYAELLETLKKGVYKEKNNESVATTESTEALTTTSSETVETTTAGSLETTTSFVDSFTVIGEDDDSDDVFKRTITELPPVTTEQAALIASTTQTTPITTGFSDKTLAETTTEIPNITINEIPESTLRYNKSTKSIRATTTEPPVEKSETSIDDHVVLSSTLLPKYTTNSQPLATTSVKVESSSSSTSSSSSPVEIIDDEKFKYSTLLPDTTTFIAEFAAKSADSTAKTIDSLNKESLDGEQNGSGNNLAIITATVSVVVVLIAAGVAYFVWKRRSQQKFSQRCRPVGLDAYSLDNVSVFNSVRRKANALRLSKRSYGNSAFEDPSLQSNVLDYQSLQDFTKNKTSIYDEFKEIPQVTVRVDEVPDNCEDKNRYANVVPLPETRVHLQRQNSEEKTEYINASYVKGPKDNTNYYIATQAPLENTVPDFWRMIWEQNSKVIIMATDLTENGVERCAEYIPASVVLDNSTMYGDFQVTLKSREVKGKYAVSQLHLKNLKTNTWREIMHLWYHWPENGCPTDESSIIGLLLDARGFLRTTLPEHLDENFNDNKDLTDKDKLSTLDKTKSLQRVQGPLTVHCSPGTGRTGTLIACDIIMRLLETPPRQIDIPKIVYSVRRGRANAIRTKDQYEFIYNIANAYAVKLNTTPIES